LDLQFLDKEWALLSVQVNELSFLVLVSDFSEMLVNNFTTLEIVVIEMHHRELRLGDGRQEFVLSDFAVLTVSLDFVFL
jgi:uncharacterized membrane protein